MNNTSDNYVLFEVGGTVYAIPSPHVAHIEMVEHITLVPKAHAAIDGVVFSRGQVIPALNLRTRFGFPKEAPTMRSRMIFVQLRERLVGLLVDSAREFIRIPVDVVRPIEQTLTGISGNYLSGVAQLGERLIMLIDLEAVLDLDESVSAGLATAARRPVAPA